MRKRLSLVGLLGAAVLGLSVLGTPALAEPDTAAGQTAQGSRLTDVIPAPVEAKPNANRDFRLSPGTVIRVQPGSQKARQTGEYLAALLRKSTGYRLPVVASHYGGPSAISLVIGRTDRVGDQGYQLDVNRSGVTIRANTGDGLFSGVQTLRQLFPADIEGGQQKWRKWTVAGGSIVDYPRFAYRSAMLDLARHFHTLDEVKAYVDEIAQYKINYLHLHLADDQGWRIQIDSWPKLAPVGGGPGTGVDGVGGGYLSKADYAELNAYAASRHVTIVPEIDMPGHTNAAQSTYAELNCDGKAPPPRTDIEVGYSSLCIGSEITYKFVEDVIRELAAMTPGPYLHIGGDEAHATTPEDYAKFEARVIPMVAKYGKKLQGWHEIAKVNPPTTAVPQFWDTDGEDAATAAAAARGNKVLLSPANKSYLDMKYDENTKLGLKWAGYIEVKDAYEWNPATALKGVGESSILGVEAPLWSETLRTLDDVEFMAFPRLTGIAELGWSPQATHNWENYRDRLAKQAPRWVHQGINFYRSPQVDWK
ncbi:beta-N-acetylhexosaminidase [Amycolatopsis anabasis]|uniref:beta-N-acetylhexosaminidase n=1 Tax=Amycolatopsis anabasis TaxID=1840409 RepID=UPI001FEB2AB1|nr:beta-N-acetylhexosaminidase [Amycolatopsis anabasis]